MKISVITLHNIRNYGSVLQTYATQHVLKKLGNDIEFIDYYRDGFSVKEQVDNNLKFSTIYNKNFLYKSIGRLFLTISINKQDRVFKRFLKNNIKLTKKYFTSSELKNNPPISDVYCSGSDQVWNSDWNRKIDESFFLNFGPENCKRISFASSIGKSEISSSEANTIIPLLSKYQYITVREQSAVNILKENNIDSELILDPTLLLNKDEWQDFIGNKIDNKKYILVYQLNTKFKEFDEYVNELSKKVKLPVIRVSVHIHQLFKKGNFKFCPEIKDFLNYIKNAEYVITDSFHCVAFSINFNKKFMAVYPPKFPTRIENILSTTNLVDRKYSKENDIETITKDINYKDVNKILNQEREKSMKIIKKMLESVND